MDSCDFEDRIRENAHALERGELAAPEEAELRAHLERCPSCRRELALQSKLCAMVRDHSPGVDVPDAVWTGIERRLDSAPRISWFRVARAAAAALILGALGLWLWNTLRDPASQSMAAVVYFSEPSETVLKPGRPVAAGESVRVTGYTALVMPGVGSLRVRAGTEAMFIGPREIRISSGEVYAEIAPGGAGFVIHAGRNTVEVLGTKYGVRWAPDQNRGEVYVVEGAVRCAGAVVPADHGMDLASGKVSRSDSPARLDWMYRHEPVVMTARLDVLPRSRDRLEFEISLRTPSALPAYLHALDHTRSYAFLKGVDPEGRPFAIRLDRETIHRVSAPGRSGEMIRLEPGQTCTIQGSVPLSDLARPGTYTLSAQLVVEKNGSAGAWFGTVMAPSVEFVRN